MLVEDRETLQKTWHRNMADREKDIYFCKMSILNAREYQKDDELLARIFGLSNSIITMNRFHKDRERSNMEKLEKLMGDTMKDEYGNRLCVGVKCPAWDGTCTANLSYVGWNGRDDLYCKIGGDFILSETVREYQIIVKYYREGNIYHDEHYYRGVSQDDALNSVKRDWHKRNDRLFVCAVDAEFYIKVNSYDR